MSGSDGRVGAIRACYALLFDAMVRHLLCVLLATSSAWAGPDELDTLVVQLDHGMSAVRCEAARRIMELGPRAAPAVPALLRALRADTLWAGDALTAIGAPAVPALVEALAEPAIADKVCSILGRMGAEAAPAVPAVAARLRARDEFVRKAALTALGRIGPPAREAVKELRACLGDPDADVRVYAARSLFAIGAGDGRALSTALTALLANSSVFADEALVAAGKPALKPLLEALPTANADARERIVDVLRDLEEVARPAVPLLLELLQGEHGAGALLRLSAARALVSIGPDATAIPVLERALVDPTLAGTCVEALATIGAPAEPALLRALRTVPQARVAAASAARRLGFGSRDDWRVALQDASATVRVHAAHALLRLGRQDDPAAFEVLRLAMSQGEASRYRFELPGFKDAGPTAAKVLRAWLSDEDSATLRANAVYALATLAAEEALAAEDALHRATRDRDKGVRLAAAFALARMGRLRKTEATALVAALRNEDPGVRAEAADELGRLREKRAVPALIEAAEDEEASVTLAAVDALVAIGEPAVPALVGALSGRGYDAPAEALARIGKPSVPVLMEAAAQGPAPRRAAAVELLATYHRSAPEVVPALVRALADDDHAVRAAAVKAVGAAGPVAREALPRLRAMLADGRLRLELLDAIWRIGGNAEEVVPALKRMLADPDQDHEWVVWHLEEMAATSPEAKAALRLALDHASVAVRAAAALALVDGRADRDRCLAILIAALGDEYAATYAGHYLRTHTFGKRAPLVEALRHRDEAVRLGAAAALADYGLERKEEAVALGVALRDRSVRVRRRVAEALEYTAPLGHAAEVDLVRALQDEDARVRRLAATALGSNGIALAESIPALLDALGDRETMFPAANALASRGREVVPRLIRLLKEGSTEARTGAAMALGEIGRPAGGALDLLTDIARDRRAAQGLRLAASTAARAIAVDLPVKAIGLGGGAGK